jgi:hypothetical protein
MNFLFRRALILLLFAAIFAGSLIVFELATSSRRKQAISSEPTPDEASGPRTRPQQPVFSLPPAPPAAPQFVQPVAHEEKKQPAAPAALQSFGEGTDDLRELFASGVPSSEAVIDRRQIMDSLREHVAKNHPSLKFSDREYERLADVMKTFREANLKVGSLERTSANAAEIRRSLQEMATAMQDFRQITGMTQSEFFSEKDAPVQFGDDEGLVNNNEEIVADFLVDHQP